jgi:hypothetical protein
VAQSIESPPALLQRLIAAGLEPREGLAVGRFHPTDCGGESDHQCPATGMVSQLGLRAGS